MARLPRFVLPGVPQHVILRGNNRSPIFAAPDDYRFFLEKLKAACEKHGCALHAYVLMTNHVHFLLSPGNSSAFSKAMQMLGRYYVQYFNFRHKRTGTLFEGRYRATMIDTEQYFLICMRYIEMNPVRANMVANPGEYPWSSYACNALGSANDLLTPHDEYLRLGKTVNKRLSAYQELFDSHLSEANLTAIREAGNKGWPIGSEQFKQMIQSNLGLRAMPSPRGGDRKSKEFQINRV
ncbi:transposase [Massilia sp. W12]|uniref:transposase n=1 Tax=Massilia sp. W12 TaxID=3126507 RepID=UPI0030D4D049